jgi:hypothetical protein
MSFRTGILPAIARIRALTGPDGFDIRMNQVTIAVRTWSGARLHQGSATDATTVLPQHFPVKHLEQREIANSGGVYEMGDILVDHITPTDGADVGYSPTQLKPTITTDNQERVYILTGTHAGEYALVELRTFRPFTWQLVLRRRLTTP